MSDSEAFLAIVWSLIIFVIGLAMGTLLLNEPIEIQDITETDSNYYITINNEIYKYEVK